MLHGFVCHFEIIFGLLTKKNATWVRSRKRCLKCSPGTADTFSASWPTQNATCFQSIKRCFKLSNDTLKSFSASWRTQNATCLNSIKRRFKYRMAFWTHFFLLPRPKFYSDVVEKTMFPVLPWHFEIILCLLTRRKCDFSEVDKAMIQVVARHCEIIFCVLTRPKCD